MLSVKSTHNTFAIYNDDRPLCRVNTAKLDNTLLCYATEEVAQKEIDKLESGDIPEGYTYYTIPTFEFWWEDMPYLSHREKEAVIEVVEL